MEPTEWGRGRGKLTADLQFQLLLCRTLHRTLRQLRAEMSQKEYRLWLAEYNRRPWGDDVEDLRNAHLCSTIANFATMSPGTFTTADFLLRFHPEPEMSDEEIKAALDGWG